MKKTVFILSAAILFSFCYYPSLARSESSTDTMIVLQKSEKPPKSPKKPKEPKPKKPQKPKDPKKPKTPPKPPWVK